MLACHELLGGFHSHSCVTAIGVGTDGLAEFLVQGRTADQNDVILAHALFLHRIDHDFHIGHGGGQQGRHAKDIGLFAFQRFQILLDRVVDAKVFDLEASAFHHHADKVLADVVDVAFDGADHHLAHTRSARGDQQRLQDEHATLHCVGGQQHFWNEQDAVAEVGAHDGHARHKRLGQHVIGRPAARDQNIHALFDLFLQTVVKIVMHLKNKFVVRKLGQDDFVFVGHISATWAVTLCMRPKAAKDFSIYDMPRMKADSKGSPTENSLVNVHFSF